MAKTKKIKKDKKIAGEKVGRVLGEREKLFCQYYLGIGHKGTFGNVTQSYWDAYYSDKEVEIINAVGEKEFHPAQMKNPITGNYTTEYNSARTLGSRLYANVNIKNYIKSLVKDVDLEFEMGTVAKQNDQLNAKVQAGTLLAKLTGKLKEQAQVNIPEITFLADSIKGILGGLKK